MEYPLGGRLHCSHGAGNGLLLPYVMRFNLPVREAEIARIAELLCENIRGCSSLEAAERGIAKVERLRENQPRLAINMLEELRHSHPQNPWVVTSEAMMQIQAEDPVSARKSLAPFLKQHPTHPRANAVYALACGQMDGFIATRKMANRAFKLCTPATVNTVGAIAVAIPESSPACAEAIGSSDATTRSGGLSAPRM